MSEYYKKKNTVFKGYGNIRPPYFIVWTSSQEEMLQGSTFWCGGNSTTNFWKIRLKHNSKTFLYQFSNKKFIVQKDSIRCRCYWSSGWDVHTKGCLWQV